MLAAKNKPPRSQTLKWRGFGAMDQGIFPQKPRTKNNQVAKKYSFMHIPRDTFDGRHSANHLRCKQELVINGINYKTQLVSLPSIVSFYHNDGQNQNPAPPKHDAL